MRANSDNGLDALDYSLAASIPGFEAAFKLVINYLTNGPD